MDEGEDWADSMAPEKAPAKHEPATARAEIKKPVPFPPPITDINALADAYDAPYNTLFRTLYVYGARIGEALKLNVKDFHQTEDEYGRQVLVAMVLTEKNRRTPVRNVPAILAGENLTLFQRHEAAITSKVLAFLEQIPEGRVFPGISRQMTFNVFSKQTIQLRAVDPQTRTILEEQDFKLHAHLLRHARLTHLVEEYHYDMLTLMRYAGWTDPRPAGVYVQLDWASLAEAMNRPDQKRGGERK